MPATTAKLRRGAKHFEVLVDLDDALKFKKGETEFLQLETDVVFTDAKKGEKASASELKEAFGTTDPTEIGKKIIKSGEVHTTQEFRDAESEKKFKQVIDFLSRNAVDPKTGNPLTPERLKNALEQSNVNVKNTPIETQISDILDKLSKIIPIKLETKRVKIIVPATHTGKVYGIIQQYKESENWLANGDLEAKVKVPAGLIMDFYDKLNSMTHGSAITEEIKE